VCRALLATTNTTKTISKAWASSPSKGFEKEWRRREIGGGKDEGAAADVG
jgi:hypothetical protein